MSKADYEARIQADGKAVQDAVAKISASFSSIKTVAKEVAADNDTLVKALRVIDAELTKLAQAAKDGDQVAAALAANAIQNSPEIKAGQAAVKDMKKKGYKVGVLGN